MLDHQGRFIIDDYMKKEPFASFLPGIAGGRGVPMWCYTVSRGQCVSSFGVQDKDGAIMEFFPAHQAYQYTPLTGFRTFLRVNGRFVEPFARAKAGQRMIADMNELIIEEDSREDGLFVSVRYNTLPEERCAALMRAVTIKNTSDRAMEIDLLDGMSAILPYGIDLWAAKQMTQTAKAWMQAEDTDKDVVCFRVRASMKDTSDVQEMTGVNFAMAVDDGGETMRCFVQPRHVFGQDTSLREPAGFMETDYETFCAQEEVTVNILPCCFFGRRLRLAPGESARHDLLIGQAESRAHAHAACEKLRAPGAFDEKAARCRALARELTDAIATKTADATFDMYCRQTMLDNLLRGGRPEKLPGGRMIYLYSRKHGDPERDYNAFRMRPEYYSQGNGNFRDVNQNRRCDVRFDPRVGDMNVRLFYNLIQLDGYNPLVIECMKFTLSCADREELLGRIADKDREEAAALLAGEFTPGQLAMAAENWAFADGDCERFLAHAFVLAKEGVSATFGEGYWSDHWTYNLDQIESYLSVFPEKEKSLLFSEGLLSWFVSPEGILPRSRRYVKTARGVRQYNFLDKREIGGPVLRGADGKAVTASVMEKLLLLCGVKTATLDPFGMGVEMEGGKPGWYDALNGLPGLLGSSMPETLELARVIDFTLSRVCAYGLHVPVLHEIAQLLRETAAVLEKTRALWQGEGAVVPVWDTLCGLREDYRAKIVRGVSGEKTALSARELCDILGVMKAFVDCGIRKALSVGDGLCPTYFAYTVTAYTQDEEGIHPTAFEQVRMPDFLEGQVRFLRLDLPKEEKARLCAAVGESRLYDRKLRMYKVNAQLGTAGYEIGRAHAFTPGWLENESVWLHMEYKYLLELLRSGQYDLFARSFHDAAVPFLDEKTYGRSVLENSSFIASSANPDEAIHGKGFVARLSGSTAEFLSIWQIMLLGETLFTVDGGELALHLAPALPAYLTAGRETIEATLLGRTKVVYHIAPGRAYFPGGYETDKLRVVFADGQTIHSPEGVLRGSLAERVRNGEAERIDLWLK